MVRYPLPAFLPAIFPVAMSLAATRGDTCSISAAMAVSIILFSISSPITQIVELAVGDFLE